MSLSKINNICILYFLIILPTIQPSVYALVDYLWCYSNLGKSEYLLEITAYESYYKNDIVLPPKLEIIFLIIIRIVKK